VREIRDNEYLGGIRGEGDRPRIDVIGDVPDTSILPSDCRRIALGLPFYRSSLPPGPRGGETQKARKNAGLGDTRELTYELYILKRG
jgi:hypothetical protein